MLKILNKYISSPKLLYLFWNKSRVLLQCIFSTKIYETNMFLLQIIDKKKRIFALLLKKIWFLPPLVKVWITEFLKILKKKRKIYINYTYKIPRVRKIKLSMKHRWHIYMHINFNKILFFFSTKISTPRAFNFFSTHKLGQDIFS